MNEQALAKRMNTQSNRFFLKTTEHLSAISKEISKSLKVTKQNTCDDLMMIKSVIESEGLEGLEKEEEDVFARFCVALDRCETLTTEDKQSSLAVTIMFRTNVESRLLKVLNVPVLSRVAAA